MAQWSLEILVRVQALSQQTGAVHNWPSIVRVKGVFCRQGCPCSSDSSGGPGADTVAGCTVFPPTHWRLWVKRALCQEAVWLGWVLSYGGRMVLDLCLSRVRTGVALMRQDCNYQLDTMKLGVKK